MTENIKVFKQNSIRIATSKGNVYVDSFEMQETPHDAAYVLITHDHYDHFSPESIEKVACKNTILVVPENMLEKAKEAAGYVSKIVTVKPNEIKTIDGLEIETIPSYNIGKPFHPESAGWVGYIINTDGTRIYVAGDTDAIPEAKQVKCDVALIPIGGKYTMDAKEAAELINIMKPAVAIPVHYGQVVGNLKNGEEFARNVKAPVKVELMIR